MVRALASHQCLGSIPGVGVISGLNLLLVLLLVQRGFYPGTPVVPAPKKKNNLDYCQALYHEPPVREIAQALPVLLALIKLLYLAFYLIIRAFPKVSKLNITDLRIYMNPHLHSYLFSR